MKLKSKNREKLENWYANKIVDDLDCYSAKDFFALGMYGITGAKEFTDEELVEEYREYKREQRG